MTDVVIPAHDEAATIQAVVTAARFAPSVSNITVVADACTDNTATLAYQSGADVLEVNYQDKGSAMAAGLDQVATDDVLFIDGDLCGLAWQHVEGLIQAAPAGGMVCGLRDEVATWTGKLLPSITGERRLPAAFARSVGLRGQGYRSELLIDAAVGKARLPHRQYVMVGVTNPSRATDETGSWLSMWGELAWVMLLNAPELWSYMIHPNG